MNAGELTSSGRSGQGGGLAGQAPESTGGDAGHAGLGGGLAGGGAAGTSTTVAGSGGRGLGAAGGGGEVGGRGGATDAGGPGSAGAGGTLAGGGRTGSAGATGELSPMTFAGPLDGHLYLGSCSGGTASFECPLSGCTGGVLDSRSSFVLAGDPGTVYDLTLHIYGVVELRSDYHGGMRRSGSSSNAQSGKDFWYAGGTFTEGDGYNAYRLRVTPPVSGVANADADANNYFLNARDTTAEGHEVWELNYEATVPVQGGGSIEFRAYDPNCLQIMNNQETARPSGSGTGTNGSLVVALDAADPPPESAFVQPPTTGGRAGQWIFVDVVAVKAR